MKSTLMQAKKKPEIMADKSNQEKALHFLTRNSTLTSMSFWKNLKPESRLKAAQFFMLQDITETTNTRIVQTKDKAAVYVVLSGFAEVSSGPGEAETTVGVGQIFGAVDLFDMATANPEQFEKIYGDETHTVQKSMNATLHKGSYLRISLNDLYKYIVGVKHFDEILDEESDEKIAEMAWGDLSDEDRYFIDVYKRTRVLLNKDLFSFLDSYKLIPKNARMPSHHYYCEGEYGREIVLDPKDSLYLYVVIEGAFRVEIEAKREGENSSHTVSCNRKNRKPMVIEVSLCLFIALSYHASCFFKNVVKHLI